MKIEEVYLDINSMSRSGTAIGTIKAIVIHWVGNAGSSALANRNYFNSLQSQNKVYASSHYIIGLEGEVLACVPENEIAYHAKQANSYSIGIECCHPSHEGKFNAKTYKSLIDLCTELCKKYDINPRYQLIRHYDVTGKICPKYYVENPKDWDQLKEEVAAAINKEDQDLAAAVKKIIEHGYLINFASWKEEEFINLKNVPSLINKLGGMKRLVEKKIISDQQLWESGTYTKSHVRSLLIKFSNSL